ncbi:MAG TPA: hypothetical protein VHD36_19085 [Pirellulales bacterium]|nr:hypothetical protein [Pirellulales bacterium]
MRRLILFLAIAACASGMARAEEPVVIPQGVIEAAPASTGESSRSQQVLVTLRLVEIDVTVLRQKGFDFRIPTPQGVDAQRMAQLRAVTDKVTAVPPDSSGRGDSTITPCGSLPPNHPFFALLDALERQKLATELCAPNVTTEEGKTSSFRSGSEFPSGRTPEGRDIKKFAGTSAEVATRRLPEDQVHVKLALSFSEIDASQSVKNGGVTIPGLKIRECATEFQSRLGETWICSGLTQKRSVATGKKWKAGTSEHLFRQLLLVTTQAIDQPVVAGKPLPASLEGASQPVLRR